MKRSAVLAFTLAVSTSGPLAHAVLPAISPHENNAVITGNLTSDAACVPQNARDEYQVWVSVGQILLYQVDVPQQGSFEFHVKPGKYDVTATNMKGCSVVAQVTVGAKRVAQVNLKLVPKKN